MRRVYLDHNATRPVPPEALEAMQPLRLEFLPKIMEGPRDLSPFYQRSVATIRKQQLA